MENNIRDPLEKLDQHLDRMANPQTEEDYWYALQWETMLIGRFITSKYVQAEERLLAIHTGLWDYEMRHVDLGEEVSKKMTISLWHPTVKLVLAVCQKFGVASPLTKEVVAETRSFKQWWEQIDSSTRSHEEYPNFIFERIPRTLLSAAAKQMQKAANAV